MLSHSTQYAIRAMTFLASQPPGKLSGAQAISKAQNIPKPFLWKVLHKLERKHLVRSFKGKGGGYELARPAGRIPLSEILNVAGLPAFERCVLGLPKCTDRNPCELHRQWKEIRNDLRAMLRQNTVGDLARSSKKRRQR